MNQYQIISKGISLKTYDDLDISLNYLLENIEDISKKPTNWTSTIALPGTSTNNLYFKHIFDVNIDAGTFNPNKKIEAIITTDDNIVFTGYLQLLNLFVNQGDVEYNVSIFGELDNVINKMSDLTLNELIDLSEYNHIRNQANIVNSFNYNIIKNNQSLLLPGPGEGYVYPDIVYGGSSNIANTKLIYEMFPAVYVKTIVDKLFTSLGYRIKSNFFESDYFKKLIIPFTNDKIQLSEEQQLNKTTRIGIPYTTTPIAATPYRSRGSFMYYTTNLSMFTRESGTVDENGAELIFTDPSNQFDASTSLYINETAGWYDINFIAKTFAQYNHDDGNDIEYKVGSGSFVYGYSLYLERPDGSISELDSSGVGSNHYIEFTPSSGTHASPWFDNATPIDITGVASNVWLSPGDKLYIGYDFAYPYSVHWVGLLNDDKIKSQLVFEDFSDNTFSKFTIEPTSNQSMGNELIDLNQSLPTNYKAVDFIGSLVNMFKLIIKEDRDDSTLLIIEPKDDYYSSKQKVLEWDDILEYKLDYKITPMSELDATEYLFTYSDDDDYLNKEYKNETKLIYGEFRINVDNDFSNKTDKTELSFSPTPNGNEFIDDRIAPFFVERKDNDLKQKKVKPRILFYGGPISCNQLTIKDSIDGIVVTNVTEYPYCGMWDHPTAPMYDLGFGRTNKIYWNSGVFPTQNLFEKFHKSTINNIINPNSRLFEGKFHLTSRDIADFDFRDIVFLLGSYWRVIEIKDYSPIADDRLTTVILNKIVDIEILGPLKVKIPVSNNSCPFDIVTKKIGAKFVHVSKSGLPVSEDCCNILGGNYIDGTCYIGEIKPNYDIATSVNISPITEPTGPVSSINNENTINSPGAIVKGTGNFVGKNVDQSVIILGKHNTVADGLKSVLVVGDNKNVTQSNTIYADNINGVPATTVTNPTLQNVYDNSTPGEIVTNVTNGAVSIKNGTGNNADNNLEIKDDTGNITASINGQGDLIVDSVFNEIKSTDATRVDTITTDAAGSSTGILSVDGANIAVLNIDPTSVDFASTDGTNLAEISVRNDGKLIRQTNHDRLDIAQTGSSTGSQMSREIKTGWVTETLNATPFNIANVILYSTNCVYWVRAEVIGRRDDNAFVYYGHLNAAFKYGTGVGQMIQISTTDIIEKTTFTTATSNIITDGDNIYVQITGEAATDIVWTVTLTHN